MWNLYVLGSKGEFKSIEYMTEEEIEKKKCVLKNERLKFEKDVQEGKISHKYKPEKESILKELRNLRKTKTLWILKSLEIEEKRLRLRRNYLVEKKEYYKQKLLLLQKMLDKFPENIIEEFVEYEIGE